MKKATYIFGIIATLLSCKGNTESDKRFSHDGEFAYNIQLAHFKTGQVESKGECTQDSFIKEFKNFDWKEQLIQANIIHNVSPTIAVIHNESKQEMGISVVGNSSDDYGFWIFYGKSGDMSSIELYEQESILPYIKRFFNRDFENLKIEFSENNVEQ